MEGTMQATWPLIFGKVNMKLTRLPGHNHYRSKRSLHRSHFALWTMGFGGAEVTTLTLACSVMGSAFVFCAYDCSLESEPNPNPNEAYM